MTDRPTHQPTDDIGKFIFKIQEENFTSSVLGSLNSRSKKEQVREAKKNSIQAKVKLDYNKGSGRSMGSKTWNYDRRAHREILLPIDKNQIFKTFAHSVVNIFQFYFLYFKVLKFFIDFRFEEITMRFSK